MADTRNDRVEPTVAESTAIDADRDPITGEPVHPLGTGIGAAAGGVAAGAAGGAVAGPVGGGRRRRRGRAGGQGIAASIDPIAEDQLLERERRLAPLLRPVDQLRRVLSRRSVRLGAARLRHADRTFSRARPRAGLGGAGGSGRSPGTGPGADSTDLLCDPVG